jgi:formate dehydrogenase alpha subunit
MEKSGTFTNTEGHVQAVRPAIEPVGDSRPDWEVFVALSFLMGPPLEYVESRDILKEIRSLIPGYGSLGPAPMPPRPDRSVVDRYLAGGYRPDLAERYRLDAPTARQDGIVQLELMQSLFHSGKLSTRSRGLVQIEGTGALRINPRDAARFALKDGDRVRLSNVRGEMTVKIRIVGRIPQGSAWFPDHFGQKAAHLFECTIDPVTRTPSIRTTLVSMMKVA